MYSATNIVTAAISLLPKGLRASLKKGGNIDRLFAGVAMPMEQLYASIEGVYASMFPDDANFNIEDALSWEKKLGIVARPSVSLEDRKKAIAQKMYYPTSAAPRQHYLFIQEQLRAAGFDVYVHLNPTGATPESLLSPVDATMHDTALEHDPDVYHSSYSLISSEHSTAMEHDSDIEHGATYDNIVVNNLSRSIDAAYMFNGNYGFSFFIAGSTLPNFAEVSASREEEFRQLVLQLKPLHTQAILFINYY